MLSDGLTAHCGINLALMQYLDLTGQRPAARRDYAEGVKWLESIADFHSFTQYHERGELGVGDWLKSIRGARAFALFAWDDPLPFLVERKFGLSYLRVFAYLARQLLSAPPRRGRWRSRGRLAARSAAGRTR
jgi:predicted ATP-grasp superfamily ATP-dependent carboligase